MLTIALMSTGTIAAERSFSLLLPLTLRMFTASSFVLSWFMAMNYLCGFIVQPIIATRSDTTSTRFGRRRPYLIAGFPLLFILMLAIGIAPYLFPDATTRHSFWVLVLVFVIIIAYLATTSMNIAIEGPLYADIFARHGLLGRANAIRFIPATVFSLIMTGVVLKGSNEQSLIALSTTAVAVALPPVKTSPRASECHELLCTLSFLRRLSPVVHVACFLRRERANA